MFTRKGLDLSPNELSREEGWNHQKVEIQTQSSATFLNAPPLTDGVLCPMSQYMNKTKTWIIKIYNHNSQKLSQ